MRAIDLNADLGETVDGAPTADDEAMFALVSSASVACGGHAGDEESMRAAVERGRRMHVAVGAHPSYPDRAGFGRRMQALHGADLRAALDTQLAALEDAGAEIRYVKPHGALYHAAGAHRSVADAVTAAVADLAGRRGVPVPLLGLGDELAAAAARAGLPFVREAFLDRGYLPDGTLVPRGHPGDLEHDVRVVADRALRLAERGEVRAVDGTILATDARSLCLHGDTPAAVAMARAVRAALDGAGIAVRPPW